MLDAQKTEHGPEVPSYQMFDSLHGAVLRWRTPALSQRRGRPDRAVGLTHPRSERRSLLRTPDVYAFALSAQGADQPAGTGNLNDVQTDFFQLVTQGGIIAESVLVLLLV